MSSLVSPPITPIFPRHDRAMSTYSAVSPATATATATHTRPQSMVVRSARSRSRISATSSIGGTRTTTEEDVKTAVRVVVRVRPSLRPSDPGYELIPQRFQRSTLQVPTDTSLSIESPQGRKLFIFDRVFGEDTTQKAVWDYLEDSVDSFLQGYNVSVLAYGQSGAGKSYTMGTSGPDEQYDPSNKGIIPRAAAHLFSYLDASPSHSRQGSALKTPTRYSYAPPGANTNQKGEKTWQMTVTYVEIYNEQPRDLLLSEGVQPIDRPTIQIREDPKGRILVEGLRAVHINSIEELMDTLNRGSAIRQTDATAINSRSSRSHAIFTVNLQQVKSQSFFAPRLTQSGPSQLNGETESSTVVESKLNFVDLAGSERLKNTGATGDRVKEGININQGLHKLGKVISQLSSRSTAGHVSYRDSKLTRLLQDSIGGNAITYMVACVTPAEFHLSETLNTVQYASRARNIQSKPKIQQIDNDTDKQATIERLRSEVAFLRQQIRSADTSEPKTGPITKSLQSEIELQSQLLDVQECYKTLSERHLKLVAELSKSTDTNSQSLDQGVESAADRLKRSQENQEQIEQIILEYEKTIQSLEANLSITKSTLASTEGNLLEKETKCAYIETMNQQLNLRIQKFMNREANTESYLHDLEARLDDTSTGSEKQDAIVLELRKEIARIRESESNAEDYISTLEERLAEADQDLEMLNREVERLEQIIQRQRSLGKLDNLLYELDNAHKPDNTRVVQGSPKLTGIHQRPGSSPTSVENTSIEGPSRAASPTTASRSINLVRKPLAPLTNIDHTMDIQARADSAVQDLDHPSPAQQQFMNDKFESVSQELFDLRLEHENTVNDYDLLSAKYHEALRTLAEMQDHLEEARNGPVSKEILPDQQQAEPTTTRDKMTYFQLPPKKNLVSEISSVGPSPAPIESVSALTDSRDDLVSASEHGIEVERLQALVAEHEASLSTISREYQELQEDHKFALDTVEKLKTENMRSKSPMPTSPVANMLRRPPSAQYSNADRSQRSLTALRGLIADELDGKADKMEASEAHLTSLSHELNTRLDRIRALESDLQTHKKEMDLKTTIINGLQRERNSLKSGPTADLGMVSQMRDQLIQKEIELKNIHEGYGKQELELRSEIQALHKAVDENAARADKSKTALEEQQKKLKTTSEALTAALANVKSLQAQREQRANSSDNEGDVDTTALIDELERHRTEVEQLKRDLERQESTNSSHVDRIAELTQMHETASKDIHEHSQIIQAKSQEIEQHKVRIAAIQTKMREAEAAAEVHKQTLKSLHEMHANELEELKLNHAAALAGYDDQIAELNVKHGRSEMSAETTLSQHKIQVDKIMEIMATALGHPTSLEMVGNHVQDLAEMHRSTAEANKRLTSTNAELELRLDSRQTLQELEEEVQQSRQKISTYQQTIKELANEVGNHEETIRSSQATIKKHEDKIRALEADNQKKVGLIEELEQQLSKSYEHHRSRLSVVHTQSNQALHEAQQRIAILERSAQRGSLNPGEIPASPSVRPQSPLNDTTRSNSITNNLRKSASIASLPSPPPAVPLPPLPALGTTFSGTANPSPPQSRHTSKEVPPSPVGVTPMTPVAPTLKPGTATVPKDIQTIKRQSAIIDDQDSRLRTMEKHLHAEKQLTATLEEALVDLETQSNKLRADAEQWKKKAWALEEEVMQTKKEDRRERLSVQQVEEEKTKRRQAEEARAQLEERMRVLKQTMEGRNGKKKRSTLNCF